jgi:hypothetical protein
VQLATPSWSFSYVNNMFLLVEAFERCNEFLLSFVIIAHLLTKKASKICFGTADYGFPAFYLISLFSFSTFFYVNLKVIPMFKETWMLHLQVFLCRKNPLLYEVSEVFLSFSQNSVRLRFRMQMCSFYSLAGVVTSCIFNTM